jgi:hypothetical protein
MDLNVSPVGTAVHTQLYSALGGGALHLKAVAGWSAGIDFCIDDVNHRFYSIAAATPMLVLDSQTLQQITSINVSGVSVACGYSGTVYAGTNAPSGPNLFSYDVTQTNVGSLRTGPNGISRIERRLKLSGDGTRVIGTYYATSPALTIDNVP